MQAIILAAGMGRRLGRYTRDNTKCMVKVGGETLIDRLLTQLSRLSLSRVVIVVGYQGEALKRHIGSRYDAVLNIEYADNPIYERTNNIYSLWLVRDRLQNDDTLLIESDLIFEDGMFERALADVRPNLALVAKYEPWMDGTMVRIDNDYNIVNFVPKSAFSYAEVNSYYKTVNIYKFSRAFSSQVYVPFLDAYCKVMGTNEYYEQVLRVITLLDNADLKALPVSDMRWYEIDDAQDLDIAETIFAEPAQQLARVNTRYGGYWRFSGMLDFCYLVNPYFPPARLKDELRANFDTLLTQYPSGMRVNSLIAGKYCGLPEQMVVPGNGAAELIKSLTGVDDRAVGVIYPTFEEYPNRLAPSRIVAMMPVSDDLRYDISDIEHRFDGEQLGYLIVVNPDNPSGNYIPTSDLLSLAQWCDNRDIKLVVDQSFADFADDYSSNSLLNEELLLRHHNLVVIKSISKSYGVPGLRLGIMASANVDLIDHIKRDVAIWNINSIAEYYMQIFNKYEKDYRRACAKFVAERELFVGELGKIGFLKVLPSQANYVLAVVNNNLMSSTRLTERLLGEFNILIKDCSAKRGLEGRNMIRIAIRSSEDNNRLLDALHHIESK